jgi:hypothetical protein
VQLAAVHAAWYRLSVMAGQSLTHADRSLRALMEYAKNVLISASVLLRPSHLPAQGGHTAFAVLFEPEFDGL